MRVTETQCKYLVSDPGSLIRNVGKSIDQFLDLISLISVSFSTILGHSFHLFNSLCNDSKNDSLRYTGLHLTWINEQINCNQTRLGFSGFFEIFWTIYS